ncbi:hypothetical protein DFA_02524 [Cavenderia fasciculata]|uniref:Carrier domain-containing protein n=1 Tax=Cavenderia fasciculata TaxID=261658 RepID=F4PZM1_CACFS|nr:uncharacterized protein DFA_02524 [Cavenderia fasciculata]EGG18785.1 hypothetical protein DFA_02524 [Cavenderia fasciculata]|eukprot:XP_004357247.1 hypothetical protein DFA_02524 [Cavenderia fasciculata]
MIEPNQEPSPSPSLLKGKTIYESFQNAFKCHSEKDCLGKRERTIVQQQYLVGEKVVLGEFKWMTYQQVYDYSIAIGNGLRQLIDPRSFLTICANNCVEWTMTDLACIWHGIRAVPIHHQASTATIEEIVNNCQSNCLLMTPDNAGVLSELIHQNKLPTLETIIILTEYHKPTTDEQQLIDSISTKVRIVYFDEMVENGQSMEPVPHHPFESDELFGLLYTSGSTGTPKGVMMPEDLYHNSLTVAPKPNPSVHLSFLTMSHLQRKIDLSSIFEGGQIGMYSGSMETIFDDIQTLNPTMFSAISRFYNVIYEQCSILKQLNQQDKIKNILGNRVKILITFGSLTGQSIKDFLVENWPEAMIIDIYGMSEDIGFGFMMNGMIQDHTVITRVDPVPELGYTLQDKPYPRGELVYQKKTISPGYYRKPELTSTVFIDGWYYTGDIVEQLGERHFKIIDRKKNVFKLLNGEFVAPEVIESFFRNSKMIESILIYGDLKQSFLVSIVIPTKEMIDIYPIERKSELQALIYNDLLEIAKETNMQHYEMPRLVELDYHTIWSESNGLLTQTSKVCRPALYHFYQSTFQSMYQSQQDNNVVSIIKSILNIDNGDQIDSLSFTQLGGDSLTAIKLCHMIKDNNLSKLTDLLQQHMNNNQEIKNQDIDWEKEIQLDDSIQIGNKSVRKPNLVDKFNVFLTGSTGYLGSFLLYQLLIDDRVDTIYCLIRNSGEKTSVDMIKQLNNKYLLDVPLNDNNISRIVIVSGDLSLDQFGLSDESFLELANNVDLLIHNGALVNMAIPYNNTKAANVNSTREMLKLASIGDYLIPLSHVSSVGVFHVEDELYNGIITEQSIPSLDNLSKLNGYRQSKLVAEQLIKEAYCRGFPIIMHRPATIYADSRTGVDNEHDLVRMVIKGLLYMKSYPSTTDDNQMEKDSNLNSYNLVPVDWVSKSIIQLSLNQQNNNQNNNNNNNLSIYHMINETNVSIGTIGSIIRDNELSDNGEMKEISIKQWTDELNNCTISNPLYPMKSVIHSNSNDSNNNGSGEGYTNNLQFKTPFTTLSLQQLGLDPCQPISNSLIIKNINYLINNQKK